MIADTHEQDTRKYRGVSTVRPIDEAKRLVSVIDCADRLVTDRGGRWHKVGTEWATNCVLPDHEDKTPSFTVNPEKNVWFCHGCLHGGDVVELYRLARGYFQTEAAMAAAELLHEFGHEIPQRPPAWHRKQERQKPVRDAIEQAKIRSAQRRLMRILEPLVSPIEDDDERRQEALKVWDEAGDLAHIIVRGLA